MARETINLGLPYGLALPLSLTANVMIWMRIYVRVKIMRVQPFLEDWLAFASCMIFSAMSLAAAVQIENGMGLHIKDLEDRPQDIVKLAQFEWVGEWLTCIVTSLTKLSILLLYRRVFAIRKHILLTSNILLILIPVYNIPIIFAIIFQCQPVSFYWTRYIPGSAGNCTGNLVLLYYLITICNVLTDFAVLIIPMIALRNTAIGTRKRKALTVLFALGSSPGLVAIARFAIAHYLDYADFTYWMWPQSFVLELEAWLGLICVCLPTLVPLLVAYWPAVWESADDSAFDANIRSSVIARVFRSLSRKASRASWKGARRSPAPRLSGTVGLGEGDWAELRSLGSRAQDLEAASPRAWEAGGFDFGDAIAPVETNSEFGEGEEEAKGSPVELCAVELFLEGEKIGRAE